MTTEKIFAHQVIKGDILVGEADYTTVVEEIIDLNEQLIIYCDNGFAYDVLRNQMGKRVKQ